MNRADKHSQISTVKSNLPQGWEVKTLGEVCKIIAGQSPESKYYNETESGLPFYQGKKEFSDKFIGAPVKWTTKITKEAVEGDILMSVRAPVGPVNFAIQKICIGRGLASIRAGEEIDKEFLYNFLLKHKNEIVGNTGAVFNSINKTQIGNIEIPLPTFPEQQRIVAKLDQVYAAIDKAKANAEKNLENAKELFESYLNGIFEEKGDDWEEEALGKCFRLKSGDGLVSRNMVLSGIYNVYGGNGIAGKHNMFNLYGNYVIIGRVGALCGIARNIDEKIWLTDNAFKIVDYKYDFDNHFLTYLLNYKYLRQFARQAAQPVISNSSLKEVKLCFPRSINEQNNIVCKLNVLSEEARKMEAIYQQKIDELEELKKSILQKAFEGKL